ncbi:MAG: cell division protein FtsQ/DivIB [Acetobacteraceae bacterium]
MLVAAALVVLAVLLSTYIATSSGPAVKGVMVRLPAGSPVSARAVRAAAEPAIRGGLLAVNLAAVQKRVEALAWVKQAEVRRLWPDALVIVVTPERAVARWGDSALLDASGHIFAPGAASALSSLPRLQGPKADAMTLFVEFKAARGALAPLGLRPNSFVENPRGEVVITLAGGTRIELGRKDPRAKLARFITVAAPALGTALARAASVDMRYANGFAVGWKREGQHG